MTRPQTFSEKLCEYLRLRDMELQGRAGRSDETRGNDAWRMAVLENELDEMVMIAGHRHSAQYRGEVA